MFSREQSRRELRVTCVRRLLSQRTSLISVITMLFETCSGDTKDIAWLHRLDDGLRRAQAARRPVVLKPLGQGLDDFDGW